MWNEVKNSNDITEFMERLAYFHDSCLKELKYVSGAYIEENAMQPLNEKRMLSIIIHCGVADIDAIEMEFSGLKSLRLNPLSERYTCEIFQASLLFVEDDICWCDSEEWEDEDSFDYDGIAVRASALRWRVLENSLGSRELYQFQK